MMVGGDREAAVEKIENGPNRKRIVVLGAGNLLMGDEGVGVRVVEELDRRYSFPPEVVIVDGGTMGIELLPYIADCSHLLIVDAMPGEDPPGTTTRLAIDSSPGFFRNRSTPHQIGLADVLALAAMNDELPRSVTLFGIIPHRMDIGLALSPPVAAGMEQLLAMVVDELARLAVPLDQSVVVSSGKSI